MCFSATGVPPSCVRPVFRHVSHTLSLPFHFEARPPAVSEKAPFLADGPFFRVSDSVMALKPNSLFFFPTFEKWLTESFFPFGSPPGVFLAVLVALSFQKRLLFVLSHPIWLPLFPEPLFLFILLSSKRSSYRFPFCVLSCHQGSDVATAPQRSPTHFCPPPWC